MRKLSGGEDREQRIELLRHELDELEQWALPAAELAELEASHKRLANAGRLAEGAAGVVELLDGDSEFALRRALGRAHAELGKLAALDDKLARCWSCSTTPASSSAKPPTAWRATRRMSTSIPERYAEVDNHLARLHDLSRRHRLPMAELHDKLANCAPNWPNSKAPATHSSDSAAQRAATAARLRRRAADALSQARSQAASAAGRGSQHADGRTGHGRRAFAVALEPVGGDDPDPQGRERCELLVSANPGQPPRALRKVASGGELARISLAIEVATLGKDTVGSMVFDEVDTGIGGAVAEVVGQKLRALGAQRQVLCVTHLPQVAAQGHPHLRVSKHSDGDSTHTRIEQLDAAGRRDELARMLGGVEITRETRAHARQMLDRAQSQPEATPA